MMGSSSDAPRSAFLQRAEADASALWEKPMMLPDYQQASFALCPSHLQLALQAPTFFFL
jgi:hypothetical protein